MTKIEHKHIDPAGTVRPLADAERKAIERERSERLQRDHQEYLSEAREFAPTWAEAADDCVETIFSPSACEELAELSPHDYFKGFYLGKAQLLRELQSLPGRHE